MMNIFFGKGTSNSNKDDTLILDSKQSAKTKDDDLLIGTSTNNPKQTLLTQTVQQLFGKSSSSTVQSNINYNTDDKMILDQNNTDEQLIDLN